MNGLAGAMPSPRFASVTGQNPATAPLGARRAISFSVMCVACTRHQRASTVRVVEQPLHRPRARPRDALLHFTGLLRRVNVDRAGRRERHHLRQFLRRHRAQAVRRDAESRIGQLRDDLRLSSSSRAKRGDVEEEAPLAFVRMRAAESAVRVEHRQQRERDAGLGAAAATRSVISAGFAYGLPAGSWCT